MEALDAFAFFNCGPLSGASQPHKHMWLIPLSKIGTEILPFTAAYLEAGCPNKLAQYKFNHWIEPVCSSDDCKESPLTNKRMPTV